MKKIAIIYSGSKTGGGINTYLSNLFEQVSSDKVELCLFSLGEWSLTDEFKDHKYPVRIFSARRFRPTTAFDLARIIRQDEFDLVVSQGVVANAYARLASILSSVPSLVTVHSDIDFDYQNGFVRGVYKLSDWLLGWRTKRYITVSRYLGKRLEKDGISPKKIAVIYNGVEGPKNLAKKKENRRLMLGSAGRLHPVKNFTSLIEAMHSLSEDGFDLTIWGEGTERTRLEKLVNQPELELSHNISLPGRIRDIYKGLATLDIYIQPSFSEGFGLLVVEAQLSGLPVIVTPGGALPELIEDGKTGLITKGFSARDISEAVLRYYEDPKLMARCAAQGQKSAKERFEIGYWAKATISAYLEAAR